MIDGIAAIAQPQLAPVELDTGAAPASVTPLDALPHDGPVGFGSLVDALNAGGAQLERAESAENAFASGTGGLQEMVFERAKADSIVSIAAAAGSRVAQSLNTLAQMQL